jgi:UDP-N-acetylmuramate dehydrogenase
MGECAAKAIGYVKGIKWGNYPMMATGLKPEHLIDIMPNVRGKLKADEALSRYTWFKVGGPAEVLFKPADEEDLCGFLSKLPIDIPISIIGNASNLLVRDGGVPGVVIRLGAAFSKIEITNCQIRIGAAAADLNVARKARDNAISGFEFLSGIPGTLGGAIRMNAGAYGAEIKDVCLSVKAVDRKGKVHELKNQDLGFIYRHSGIDPTWIITEVTLKGQDGTLSDITTRMENIQLDREQNQPVRTLTSGSTFTNPPGHKAWQLIDEAGCRGLVRGGAIVSNLHCNFLVNARNATAEDIEGLGEEVRRRVFNQLGVMLNWEIKNMGIPADDNVKEIEQ